MRSITITAAFNGFIATPSTLKSMLRKHRHHTSISGSPQVVADVVDLIFTTIDSLYDREGELQRLSGPVRASELTSFLLLGILIHNTAPIRLSSFVRHVFIKRW